MISSILLGVLGLVAVVAVAFTITALLARLGQPDVDEWLDDVGGNDE